MKMTPFAYVLVFSGFLLLHAHAASGTLEENCKKIAGEMVTYQFCMTTLGADPKSKTADLPTLGVIASELTLARGTKLQSYINKLLQGSAGDRNLVRALKDCKAMYDESLPYDVEKAITGFESKQYTDANVHLSAVSNLPDDCEDVFKETGATANPQLLKMTADFQNVSSIALDISAILLGIAQ